MQKKLLVFLFFAALFSGALRAQQAWWVFFTDKNGSTFDPYAYFAPEAITRRQLNHLPLSDSSDFPVNEFYLGEIAKRVDTLGHVTRWFNGAGVVATEAQVAEIRQLPFVREVTPQMDFAWQPARLLPDTTVEDFDGTNRSLGPQLDPLQGRLFAQHGRQGKGIIIAVLDAGFKGADKHPAFEQLRINNQVRASFDFVKDNADVYSVRAEHGTMVLSCIAGRMDGLQMGLAPEATFLLARIAKEYGNQYRAEENFVAAVEWADKQGAMIINCSGGPGVRSYFPEQMNGKIALISRASNMAASKGMLVVAAAGNAGDAYDDKLLPPSDADSVLAVTALNDSGFVAGYSSRGPTPLFNRKPDLSAPGTAIVADGTGQYSVAEGTSFSCPLLVGFAACLMEMYPDVSAMALADTMRHAASLYPYFDYSHGYGTPQASYFFEPHNTTVPTFTLQKNPDQSITVKLEPSAYPECCRKQLSLLFYTLEDEEGRIYKYGVIEVRTDVPLVIPYDELMNSGKLSVSYEGYYHATRF